MVDILHRIGITAPASEVYESLTTIDGMSSWWTELTTGDPSPGGQVEFLFGDPETKRILVEVVSTAPDEQVVWRCVPGGPEEWIDTTITFGLEQVADETVVHFAHAGWRQPVEFMGHCSTKWAAFLLDMKAGCEGGKARPWPHDLHISSWDD